MKPRAWIDSITFNDGTTVGLDKNDLVVLVGANNVGKSAVLKEANNYLHSKEFIGKIISELKISTAGFEHLVSYLTESGKVIRTTRDNTTYTGPNYNVHHSHLEKFWNAGRGLSQLAPAFVKVLNTGDRLTLCRPPDQIDYLERLPQHPIQFLFRDDKLEAEFSRYFNNAFGLDLVVEHLAGTSIPLRIGKRPRPMDGEDRLSSNYNAELRKLDLLHEQGDGMQAFMGVLLSAFVGYYSVLLIDEPEAFLHPPQARLLGKMISKLFPDDRQIFLATHSEDLLKGLLETGHPNLKVIRIDRVHNINKISILENADIGALWSDSLLRYSNILSGLFHAGVIVCESDADCRFYSAILAAIFDEEYLTIPDVLFTHCGGKHRLPVVVRALYKLNIPVRVIVDFDVLSEVNPLREIFIELGGTWDEVSRDWRQVKESIDKKRPELETEDLKRAIHAILDSANERVFPREKVTEIQAELKKASAWANAKAVGREFIPAGDEVQAYERISKKFKDNGLFIVEGGELESFDKSIGGHGPKWVNEVLRKDLRGDERLARAREFVGSVIASITRSDQPETDKETKQIAEHHGSMHRVKNK